MRDQPSQEITRLLRDWRHGDSSAMDRLIPLVHEELRRLAHHSMRRERLGHTLQTTALVNEAYLRLVDARQVEWQDRAHFLAISAGLMRRILVDHARSRAYKKRGGNWTKLSLDEARTAAPTHPADLEAIDEALCRLATFGPREAQVAELRFFGGLSTKETAEVMGISCRSVERDWTSAKAWLASEIKRSR